MTTDGRLVRGERTRDAVLDAAVAMASADGLDGLSLGNLADTLGVSKSGLFAHWRCKEDLQLAACERAREQWIERIVQPALKAPRGLRRLWTLLTKRIDFYAEGVLPGGCFFSSVQFELDARSGPVRDRIVEALNDWMALVSRLATEAVEAGELNPDTDPDQLAFALEAYGKIAVAHARLIEPAEGYARARRAAREHLLALGADPALLPEES